MTIDEVIEIEKSEHLKCENELESEMPMYQIKLCRKLIKEKGNYHKQIAEWLEELKAYRENERIYDQQYDIGYDKGYDKGFNNGYNKAIYDFKSEVKNLIVDLNVIRFKDIDEIAEQLKVGGENE